MSVLGRRVRISLWHVFLLLATSAFAATVVVTNTSSGGPGSFSDAVNAVNNGSANEIDFSIGSGKQTIALTSQLNIYLNSVIINGTTQPGYSGTPLIQFIGAGSNDGLVFSGPCCYNATVEGLAFGNFSSSLLFLPGWSFNILGNYFGIGTNGTTILANTNGIAVQGASGSIGDGTAAGANLVSGNNVGIFANFTTAPLLVAGNFIGVAANHTTAKPNAIGILVNSPVTIGGSTPGYGNTIAFNSTAGIRTSVAGMFASENSIYSNPSGAGINYTIPPPQAAPALTSSESDASSTTIAGSVATTLPLQNLTIEFFSNPVAQQQGRTFLGSTTVTTDGAGNATFSASVPTSVSGGDYVNATATNTSAAPNSTSPFSNDIQDIACPIITTQPTSATICAGTTNTFSVTASGTSINYQWRSSPDGTTWTNIGGANASTYTTGVADFYDVVVSNACPTPATSNTVSLTVDTPPSISAQPSNVTVCATQPASFTVGASGTGLTYQWQKAGVNITGANAATYTIPSTATSDAGSYDVVVGGTCTPPQTSNSATLTVNTAPSITAQPSNVTVCATQPASFTVTATGTNLTYQWQKGGVNIAGGNAATYTIPSTAPSDAGSYDVVVSGTCTPPQTSNSATLTVNTAPAITTQPSNTTSCPGQPASFTVVATGSALAYQWQKGGVNIAGANSATYTIPAVAPTDAGTYDVIVSGTCTPPQTSSSATLTVTTPSTTIGLTMSPAFGHTGMPATFTITVTGNCAVPTGTVTLSGGVTGSGTLNNGVATITATPPAPANSVTVQYSGDSIYAANSATFAVTIGSTIPTLDPRVLVLLALALAAAGYVALRRL